MRVLADRPGTVCVHFPLLSVLYWDLLRLLEIFEVHFSDLECGQNENSSLSSCFRIRVLRENSSKAVRNSRLIKMRPPAASGAILRSSPKRLRMTTAYSKCVSATLTDWRSQAVNSERGSSGRVWRRRVAKFSWEEAPKRIQISILKLTKINFQLTYWFKNKKLRTHYLITCWIKMIRSIYSSSRCHTARQSLRWVCLQIWEAQFSLFVNSICKILKCPSIFDGLLLLLKNIQPIRILSIETIRIESAIYAPDATPHTGCSWAVYPIELYQFKFHISQFFP